MTSGESSENPTMIKAEHIRQSITSEVHKKESLSDEELGNLLAAFGNHEAKSLTLVTMKKGSLYSSSDLADEVNGAQGKNKGWRIGHKSIFNYCESTFADIGLVTKKVEDNVRGTIGFIKTDYGEKMGNALAGLLLDFSLRYPETALYRVFGATASSSKKVEEIETKAGKSEFKSRSPLTRLKIIWELATSPSSMTYVQLHRSIFPNDTGMRYRGYLHTHLVQLAEAGLISHEFILANQEYSLYQLSAEAPVELPIHRRGYPTQTRIVLELLRNDPNKVWSITDLLDAYKQHPELLGKRLDPNPNKGRSSIVPTLSFLEAAGYVYQPKFKGEEQSRIWVEEEQRLMFIDMLTLIDEFQNQDHQVLERGRMLATSFSEREICILMEKAKKNSSAVNSIPSDVSKDDIINYLRDHSDSTVKEVEDYLKKLQERELTTKRVNHLLTELQEENRAQGITYGRVKKWSVTSVPASK